MLRTSFLLQILKREVTINTGDRVMDLAFCYSPQFPSRPSISVSSFIKLPLVLALDKCVTDGRMDSRMDGQSGDYMLSLWGA